MEVRNVELLELISKSKESINVIKSTMNNKREIKKLADNIKALIDKIEYDIKEEEKKLNAYEEQLNNLYNIEMENNISSINKVIESNLPKDIECDYKGNGKLRLYTKQLIKKGTYEDKELGEIEVKSEEDNKWDIVVSIKGASEEKWSNNKFEIKGNVLRVYKVISYIHDNLSYDE